jgi:hypothetical protein
MENQIFVNGHAYECNHDCTGAMQAATIQEAQARAKHDADMASLGDGLMLVVALVILGVRAIAPLAAILGGIFIATLAIGSLINAFTPAEREKRRREAEARAEARRIMEQERLAKLSPRVRAFEKWFPRVFLSLFFLGPVVAGALAWAWRALEAARPETIADAFAVALALSGLIAVIFIGAAMRPRTP